MTIAFGPTFGDEVIAAGLGGLPFAWGSDGVINGLDNLTSQQIITLNAVIAAHNPNKLPATVIRQNDMMTDVTVQSLVGRLQSATSAQIDTFFAANVTTTAQAIATLKAVVKVLAYNLRNE